MKLSVSELSFSYENKKLFDHISFSIKEGEFVSILGPSGCGKSTILKLLTGVITPESGQIFLEQEAIKGITEHFAYMPQDDLLFSWKNILDNVCLYGKVHNCLAKTRKEALERFAAFGLDGYENEYPSSLSGGMRQRAAFLRTTLCHADILLLDEPFGALDVITRGDMQDWLLSMRKRLNKTVLLVTHDMDEAIYLSDRILIMNGSPAAISCEIPITETQRTREWLYRQGALRQKIHSEIVQKKTSFDLLLCDAHAHMGTASELKERLTEHIPSLISAGSPTEAQQLQTFLSLQAPEASCPIIPTYGLHPWQSERYGVSDMLPFLESASIVGEIGMDSIWCKIPLPHQEQVFREQLDYAAKAKKPVILHTKGQEKEVAAIIKEYPNTYLVHWYSSTEPPVEFIKLDCYFSLGPDLFWNQAVRQVAAMVPLNRLLIETDGLSAVQWASEEASTISGHLPLSPSPTVKESLSYQITCLAQILKKTEHQVRQLTETNFCSFSKIKK